MEASIHGDILESIFSHVPLIHLVPACHVSKTWNRAVLSSLCHVNPIKPWLMLHTQTHSAPHVTSIFAYDPRSHVWLHIHAPSSNHPSPLLSSHSSLLYTLSSNQFSFSFDPLHLHWHHACPPNVWRVDPIVARVGSRVVVAGGACDFEDDPLAVEMYDMESNTWIRCQSMPAKLKESSASTWVSVAVAGDRIHVTEKNSGITFSLDCDTMRWDGPYDLRPDEKVFCCMTGTVGERLVVIGMVGDAENVKEVKLWEVKGELGLGMEYNCEELGVIPREMVEKLKGEDGCGVMTSLMVTWVGDFVYVQNPSEPKEIVVCEVVNEEGRCKWGSVKNMVMNDRIRMGRMVFCGSNVGVEDLQSAVVHNCKFMVNQV